MRGPDRAAQLIAQHLQGETGLARVQSGAMHQQTGRLIDRDQMVIKMKDVQHGARLWRLGCDTLCACSHNLPTSGGVPDTVALVGDNAGR